MGYPDWQPPFVRLAATGWTRRRLSAFESGGELDSYLHVNCQASLFVVPRVF